VELAGGQRGQGRGASRAADGGGGAVTLGQDGEGTEKLVGWRPWSSARPIMVAATAFARGRAKRSQRRGGGELRRLFNDTGVCPRGGAHGKRRRRKLGMAATSSDTRRPYRHFTEHLASDSEVEVEHQFGLSTGRIRSRAQKQSRSPPHTLQILFKGNGH
jgi:hypothetical protein